MQAIKELRRRSGLSQRKLAAKAGVAYKTLQRVEAGLDTRWSTIRKLAAALDLGPEALVAPGPQA